MIAAEQIKVPANIAPFVEVLGIDGAIALFREIGGSEIYLPRVSGDKSVAAEVVGARNVERLAEVVGSRYIKVPLAKQWIAQVMFARGASLNEIARVVRSDISTVRKWRIPDAVQLKLI